MKIFYYSVWTSRSRKRILISGGSIEAYSEKQARKKIIRSLSSQLKITTTPKNPKVRIKYFKRLG